MSVSLASPPLTAAPAWSRAGEVSRERLTRRLLGAREPLVALRAPAGYGKSVAVAAWARGDRRPFSWVAPGEAVTGRRDRVFVLEDWPAGALRDLAGLVGRLGPGSQLVVASRTAIPLGRLRAQQDVLELGPGDLAMTHREAAALLDRAGASVGAAPLEELLRTTEGWPALLSLAAQALAQTADRSGAARGFGPAHPYVVDYVMDEVLAALPARVATFVRRAVVLEGLDAERCDELLARRDGVALLDAVERSGLPVVREGRGGVRLRVHPLVARVLRDDLRRREPGVEQGLRRRASRLCERWGDLDAAIEHALAGRDLIRAGELLWRRAATYAWDGRGAELGRWLAALPPGAGEEHASIALTVAMHAAPRLALGRADRALTAARRTIDEAPPALVASLWAGHAALRAFTDDGGGGAETLRVAGAAVAEAAPDGEPSRALGALLEGAGRLLAGDPAGAARPLEDGVRRAFVTAPAIAALCEAELALGALCAGDQDEGVRRAERARSRALAHGLGDRPALAGVLAIAAAAEAVDGRYAPAAADVHATVGLLTGRDAVLPWLHGQVSLALGLALLRLSDAAGGRARLADARRLAARMGDAGGLSRWIAEAEAAAGAVQPLEDVLTTAELRVLRHLPSHLSCREIGVLQQVSTNTIKSQVHAIYRKLGVRSRSAAVLRAAELGLVDGPLRSPSGARPGRSTRP